MRLRNETTGMEIGVENMPGRAKPCLVVKTENVVTAYGTFRNDFAADKFMQLLSDFCGARSDDLRGKAQWI